MKLISPLIKDIEEMSRMTTYYPSITPEEIAECQTLDTEQGTVLYKVVSDTSVHICAIVVLPEYRRQGYGRRLIEQFQNNFTTLTANVLLSELDRLPFWRSLGFRVTEVNLDAGYFGLVWNRPVRPAPTPAPASASAYIDPSLFG